jgi:SAM-dependent MidA family methyltransferase
MTTYHELTAPSEAALMRSESLREIIQQKIQQHNGQITFADFMQLALYHPTHGYYQNPDFEFGKQGDFTTAPEISPLFAYCFAKQCRQIFETLSQTNILELGAGSGRFALDILTHLEAIHALPDRYYIYEISTGLRNRQLTLLQKERPDLLARIEWLTELPVMFTGIIIANEVLDAIPFNCFQIDKQQSRERMVVMKENEFDWQVMAPSSMVVQTHIDALVQNYDLADGYQSEMNFNAMLLVKQLSTILANGVILLADYGYGQREYYHPQRNQGTIACFYKHHLHHQPLPYPGLQDITAHVDFTHVIETAADQGAQLSGFTTQSGFLLANGLLQEAQRLEAIATPAQAFQLHQAIKTLTMPTEMGDRVKIMAISKQVSIPLIGFATLDRRRDL